MGGGQLLVKNRVGNQWGMSWTDVGVFHTIAFSPSQLIILLVSSSKYPVEEDQLFIPESIYHGKQTHSPSASVRRKKPSCADGLLMFTLQCLLYKTVDVCGFAASIV